MSIDQNFHRHDKSLDDLPSPSPDAQVYSENLQELIAAEAAKKGGQITFSRFMELALYAPGLGYYCGGSRKLGADGDFITAPEYSSLFSRCLARQIHPGPSRRRGRQEKGSAMLS